MNQQTKKYKLQRNIFRAIDIGLTVLPLLIYTIIAFSSDAIHQKIVLGVCLTMALIFVAINLIFKHNIRCTIWIVLIGIHSCVENLMPLILIMAITTILSEFIFNPLAKKAEAKFTINKEIDKRGI